MYASTSLTDLADFLFKLKLIKVIRGSRVRNVEQFFYIIISDLLLFFKQFDDARQILLLCPALAGDKVLRLHIVLRIRFVDQAVQHEADNDTDKKTNKRNHLAFQYSAYVAYRVGKSQASPLL